MTKVDPDVIWQLDGDVFPCWTPFEIVFSACVIILFFCSVVSPWLATVNYRTLFFGAAAAALLLTPFFLHLTRLSLFLSLSLSLNGSISHVTLFEPHLYVIVWRVAFKCSSWASWLPRLPEPRKNHQKNTHTHTHPHRKQLNTEVPWVSRAFESVSSYSPTPLYMMIRSVLFSTPSAAQRASRMSECVPLTRSLWGYYFPPFSFSLLILFHFSFFRVVVKRWEKTRTFPNGVCVCVCVIRGDRIAVSLLHCCCI